jgi:16S rRNA (guanine527-N7)-methyltransferase
MGGSKMIADPTRIGFEEEIERLLAMVRESGLEARPDAGEILISLSQLIYDWNRRVNLVSRKDIKRLVRYHFCDAASLLPIIMPEVDLAVLDVGGSNGLPGLVLGALCPNMTVTVCDSRRKREGFLKEACRALKGKASYAIDRIDGHAFRARGAERFDLIVARAVTRLKLMLKWCLPLVRPGGFIVAYKGSRCMGEVREAEGYLWSHGGEMELVVGSPFAASCNPLRQFAILGKGPRGVGVWAK